MQIYSIRTFDNKDYTADDNCSIFYDDVRGHYRINKQFGELLIIPHSQVAQVMTLQYAEKQLNKIEKRFNNQSAPVERTLNSQTHISGQLRS
jgi:hypothetical protein